MGEKLILDPCCGSRMMWFDKHNPLVVFGDIRDETHVLCDGRNLEIKPDVVMDFTNIPFPDETFRMVVLDPPHMKKLGRNTWMAMKYGVLAPSWETDIKAAVDESMRVLKDYGVLIFKWNEAQINLNQVLSVLNHKPLFGHTSGKHGKTKWLSFIKIPKHPAP